MAIWDRYDPTREARPEVLAVIDDLLARNVVRTVHCIGYAHEPILRLLHGHLGAAFSVMDMPDRYCIGAADIYYDDLPWGDEDEMKKFDRYPGPSRPAWLEGVPFYQDGAPAADLLIYDCPESYASRYPDNLLSNGYSHVLLADEACRGALHPAFFWSVCPTHALGIRRT